MSDDESARPATAPSPTPEPAPPAVPAADDSATAVATEPAPTPAASSAETSPAEISPAMAPSAPREPSKVLAFVKTHAVTLVLVVLLVAAIVWGALGMTSANEWESRAGALSADLTSTEQVLADAKATIDDLETARSRAESTATACIGAIKDADAMLEVSAKLDDKTVAYVNGLNDFVAAVNARDIAAVETIGTEMDKLTAQIEDLSAEIDEHIDSYGDSADGCHVDDAQDV
jgi:prefoldin subunit 5